MQRFVLRSKTTASSLLLLGISLGWLQANAGTDISDQPLFTTVKTEIKPNLVFILDDSGSMASDFMPDAATFGTSGFNDVYGRRAAQCNGLGYVPRDPAKPLETRYPLPVDALGNTLANQSTDFLTGSTLSLLSGGTSGYLSNLRGMAFATTPAGATSLTVPAVGTSVTLVASGASYKVGQVVTLAGTAGSPASWTSGRWAVGKVTAWDAASGTLTVNIAQVFGSGLMSKVAVGNGSPVDNVYYIYKGSQPKLGFKFGPSVDTESTFYKECSSALGASPGADVFEAVIVLSGSSEAQDYANWYKYYANRMQLMKTSMSRAFQPVTEKFRVGFTAINNSATALDLAVSDFTKDQKAAFYTAFNAESPSGNTPLRAALSRVGQYFANKTAGQSDDPIQYSCQKNYALLSTDGYWNGSAGYDLNNSAVGQQDGGATPRPRADGGHITVTTVTKWDSVSVKDKYTTTPYKDTTTTVVSKTYTPKVGNRYLTYTPTSTSCGSSGSGKVNWYEQLATYDTREITQQNTVLIENYSKVLEQVVTATTPYTRTVKVTDDVTASDVTTAGGTSTSTSSGSISWTAKVPTGPTPSSKVIGSDSTPVVLGAKTVHPTYCRSTAPPNVTLAPGDPKTGEVVTSIGTSSKSTTSTTAVVTYGSATVTEVAKPSPAPTTTYSGGSFDSLADVAMYYYKTDLRDSSLSNCTGAIAGKDVCVNNSKPNGDDDPATWQHLNLFAVSLGAFGTLPYRDDYLTAATGSYASIKKGDLDWPEPNPSTDDPTHIDDLWHAAVNGRGQFFNATDADSLKSALASIISTIDGIEGEASAAATSTMQPVPGDNGVFFAQFKSNSWTGDVRAYEIDPHTGAINQFDAAGKDLVTWSARDKLDARTAASRTIFYAVGTAKREFTFDNLKADGFTTHFDNICTTKTSPALSQCSDPVAKPTVNSGANLVDFLRGGNQPKFRVPDHKLGDIVNSAPVFVGKPVFKYTESDYAKFVDEQKARPKTLYVGGNDGMLHAFDALTGDERWAYVPQLVFANLYQLGDSNYASKHRFYVDGSPVIGDVLVGGKWRTILVGGLNAGGTGYYALDVTDPLDPTPLWEFKHSNLALSFGNPIITKRKGGQWVVAFTSGYSKTADAPGHLFVVDAGSGNLLVDMPAPGSVGLGKLNAWVNDEIDNTALRFYAGDLTGFVWRFDVDNLLGFATNPVKVATLAVSGVAQPITTQIQLAEIGAGGGTKAVLIVGTGRYLGSEDPKDKGVQSLYVFEDQLTDTGLDDVRNPGVLTKEILKTEGSLRTIDPASPAVDWATTHGWYVDLPDAGERINVDPLLSFNTVKAIGNIPNPVSTDCEGSSGGKGWFYQLDVLTAKALVKELSAMGAGMSSVQLMGGQGETIITQTDTKRRTEDDAKLTSGAGKPRRSSWRELAD